MTSSACDLCILHNPDRNKNIDQFNEVLWEKIRREEASTDPSIGQIDLSGVVFPVAADFNSSIFKKDITFSQARFFKDADFGEAKFVGGAYFLDTLFSSEVDFSDAIFASEADFWRTQFCGRLVAIGAKFDGEASFLDAQFRAGVTFVSTEFANDAVFSGTKFDGDAFFNGAEFCKDAYFGKAEFVNDAEFLEAKFSGEAYFEDARFGGAADFGEAKFHGKTSFSGAGFESSADFSGAEFGGDAYFYHVRFSQKLSFSGAVVRESLDLFSPSFLQEEPGVEIAFDDLIIDNPQSVCFEDVNLCATSFLRSNVSQIQLVRCTWPKKNGRNVIYDELALDSEDDRPLVAAIYRQLRLNFESNRQEAEAGDFYIGQMEMRRQDKASYSSLYRGLLGVYRVLAMYGESYQRPIFFYFTLGLPVALLYLWGGFQIGDTPVKYGPGLDLGNIAQFGKDFVRAYIQALTAGGIGLLGGQFATNLDNSAWWVAPVRYLNMLLDTFLVGFFVIALRRHFRR